MIPLSTVCVYVDLIGNLVFVTVGFFATGILLPQLTGDDIDINYGFIATVTVITIIATIAFHVVVMIVSDRYLSVKAKVDKQSTLLDEIQEGVIIINEDDSKITYANLLAKSIFERTTTLSEQKFNLMEVDLSKIICEKVDTEEKVEPDRNAYETDSVQPSAISLKAIIESQALIENDSPEAE